MDGEIHIGTGIVQVHDICNPLPDFMYGADVIFSDPPYNQSALSSYYTKAERKGEAGKFTDFIDVFFKRIDEINPKIVILECGIKQTDKFIEKLFPRYKNITQKESEYYAKYPCNILISSNKKIPDVLTEMPRMDEEKIIDYICKKLNFSCIGDLCMGKGLVAYYANKYGKKFVGTELNKYRLAVCCERVTTGKRGNIR